MRGLGGEKEEKGGGDVDRGLEAVEASIDAHAHVANAEGVNECPGVDDVEEVEGDQEDFQKGIGEAGIDGCLEDLLGRYDSFLNKIEGGEGDGQGDQKEFELVKLGGGGCLFACEADEEPEEKDGEAGKGKAEKL